MKRIQNVTLDEAYELVKVNSFILWTVSGNYMNIENLEKEKKVETHVFMGTDIFLLGLSVERKGVKTMTSRVDLIDFWASFRTEYPQLFKDEIRGDAWVIP